MRKVLLSGIFLLIGLVAVLTLMAPVGSGSVPRKLLDVQKTTSIVFLGQTREYVLGEIGFPDHSGSCTIPMPTEDDEIQNISGQGMEYHTINRTDGLYQTVRSLCLVNDVVVVDKILYVDATRPGRVIIDIHEELDYIILEKALEGKFPIPKGRTHRVPDSYPTENAIEV